MPKLESLLLKWGLPEKADYLGTPTSVGRA